MNICCDRPTDQLSDRATQYLDHVLQQYRFSVEQRHFGVELEFSIVDSEFRLLLDSAGKVCQKCMSLPVVRELGSFQIETNPGPRILEWGAFGQLHQELRQITQAMENACNGLGGQLLPIGLAPIISPATLAAPGFFSSTPRFQASAAFSRLHQQAAQLEFQGRAPLHLENGTAIALINELHIHLEALSIDELPALFTAAQDITPLLAALGANSGYCNGLHLAYQEHQVRLFADTESRPHDPRGEKRVGLYPYPLRDLAEYFRWTYAFPQWAELEDGEPRTAHQAFEKSYYGWVRVRLNEWPEPSVRLELRIPSVQPTLQENLALSEWAVKMLIARSEAAIPPLSHEQRCANLESCSRDGLAAQVFWNSGSGTTQQEAAKVIEESLPELGAGEFIPLLRPRLSQKITPTQRLANEAARQGTIKSLRDYREHFLKDTPYIT